MKTFILITCFSLLSAAQISQAANLVCELGISKKDGSEKRVLKTETFFLDEKVTEENGITYLTVDGEDFTAQVIYFVSNPHVTFNGTQQIATRWVVTLELGSKRYRDVMDLRTEVLAPGSESINVFDSKFDGSGAAYASCLITP